jgi:predicted YcjX-like family ATPase
LSTQPLSKRAFSSVKELFDSSADSTRESLHRLSSQRKYIGVTGLSRSGKSTFITSLINQLLMHRDARLGAFTPWMTQRIAAVRVHPLEDRSLAEFPYHQAIAALSAIEPVWPQSTLDISGCLIEIKLHKNKGWAWTAATRSVFLEIRDYPGEWLLDLPLMEMSYADWCSQCTAQFTLEPRASLLAGLLGELQTLDPLAPYDETVAKKLNLEYCEFLTRCKHSEHALSVIQPGRFLLPGEFAGQEALMFVPLLSCSSRTKAQLENASDTSYFKTFARRYNRYISQIVEPFYKKFFRPINRQVVLVDVINALNGGPDYIDDMRQAISNISDSFTYGSQSPIRSLFRPKIEKVIFAASKIDQVVAKDHDCIRKMTAALVRKALDDAAYKGIEPTSEAIAAIRASHEIAHRGSPAITGTDAAGNAIGYVHPLMPDHVPKSEEWQSFREWKIPLLRPPKGVRCHQDQALPHIRMDQVLEDLIGDLCQ